MWSRVGSASTKRFTRSAISAGPWPSSAYARIALRSAPSVDAAARPLPETSPMTSSMRPPGSAIASYQSPPTSDSDAAGR